MARLNGLVVPPPRCASQVIDQPHRSFAASRVEGPPWAKKDYGLETGWCSSLSMSLSMSVSNSASSPFIAAVFGREAGRSRRALRQNPDRDYKNQREHTANKSRARINTVWIFAGDDEYLIYDADQD